MVESLLEARSIGRQCPGTDQWLLRDISLEVKPGDRLALVGPSGSGKTLLLRSLALLDPIDAGEIRWQGNSIQPRLVPQFRRTVVYLHQRPMFLEGTVEENLRYPFSFKGSDGRAFNRDDAVSALNHLGRDASFLTKSTRDLSGGEAQIVAMLRATQLEPMILLLDEPTVSLDLGSVQAVERLVQGWLDERQAERAFVWVSHDAEQAQRLAARSIRMNGGHLKQS